MTGGRAGEPAAHAVHCWRTQHEARLVNCRGNNPTAPPAAPILLPSTYFSACAPDDTFATATCNFNASLALPGTACYGRDCWGSYDFKGSSSDE